MTLRPAEVLFILENEENKNTVLLDVRTPEEFSRGHLPSAVNIDYYNPGFIEEIDKLDRNKRYLVYCRTVNRSGHTQMWMMKNGFKNVWMMEGGFIQWQREKFPMVIPKD